MSGTIIYSLACLPVGFGIGVWLGVRRLNRLYGGAAEQEEGQ